MSTWPRSGLTLAELLVALAVLGVLCAALLALEGSVLRSSAQVSAQAARLRELQEASTYVADRVRAARDLRTDLSVNGSPCTVYPAPGGRPCFALLVPSAELGQAIDTYAYRVYRVEPRTSLNPADRVNDAWADAHTFVLREYRAYACGPASVTTAGACTPASIPAGVPAVLTNTQPFLVMDGLTFDGPAGAFTPFAYDPASRVLTLRLRVGRREAGRVLFTPPSGYQELRVQLRN
ncbi:prepilin-type N-terminal cleavage/methylation domain-containing protein [Deinococcus peraridilitoris]|uniref:Prepilin-type N-terminal cleavage/methylation domain-containing protein n=1 Tax=Deinococcus peraridilitoris (strain DSM 19664 / LMG 22246 / CIP 109416 / KR-200) TaxID=937777 RepID=L0A0V7_DEIPD|nr:prepilin-type N-terminal cleavage/methylation domain-containing protein [Deinococcus peraridilitoris]AFZ67481.1 prepilin-type N-terminal cleavage/methylation domain-containing protein [Deinococcus peraridilitoris DSM 19664]